MSDTVALLSINVLSELFLLKTFGTFRYKLKIQQILFLIKLKIVVEVDDG